MSSDQAAAHPRYPLAGTVILRETAHGPTVLVELRNISLSGCYVETPRVIAEGARIRIILQSAHIRAEVLGVVKRRDAKGLGIQFTNGATVEDWKRLEAYIKELHAKPLTRAASASDPA